LQLHKSNVYVCLLDAVKAFDRVNHFGLLAKLGKKGLGKEMLLLLHSWLNSLKFSVRWNSFVSRPFVAQSGILQGSLISPKLFNVYINDMLVELNCSGYGCKFGNINAATIAYADDVLLLSGSLVGLQSLVNICVEYGLKFGISFNAAKSVSMVFSNQEWRNDPPAITVEGSSLAWVKTLKYLGVYMQSLLHKRNVKCNMSSHSAK
jgi:hypothetical protein